MCYRERMIVKTYDVFCDIEGPNCEGWATGASTTRNATEARKQAKAYGWRRIDKQDACPACLRDRTS